LAQASPQAPDACMHPAATPSSCPRRHLDATEYNVRTFCTMKIGGREKSSKLLSKYRIFLISVARS
jgi:hypothetical protein